MSSADLPAIIAVIAVTVATLAIGTFGLRFSRTTSDFFVASRTVRPGLNASAIGGEYLSAASFLGVAGLVVAFGAEMLWYPVGWTAGYLCLLVLVAAPLRRSGAYTLPDFAEVRLESRAVRSVCSVLVVLIGLLYLVPQFQGAGLTLAAVTGAPRWFGASIVAVVVLINVTLGGMRSITFVQAFQYWLKLTALLVPAMVLVALWFGDGQPGLASTESWALPVAEGGGPGLYTTYSIIVATFLGTMGLPHVVVRYYTNPDGGAARRTTVAVLALLGLFYVLPPIYAALGRIYQSQLSDRTDAVVLELPRIMAPGIAGELLTGLLTAGAFAAFLSTSSGLGIAVAGVLTQDVTSRLRRRSVPKSYDDLTAFRVAAVLAMLMPLLCTFLIPHLSVARAVGLAFAVTASTFCPFLILGIWWRGLTPPGAIAGMATGAIGSGIGVLYVIAEPERGGWSDALLAQPAAWSVPLAFAVMIAVSLATKSRRPAGAARFLMRLHVPEELARAQAQSSP